MEDRIRRHRAGAARSPAALLAASVLLGACMMTPPGARTLPMPCNPPAPGKPLTVERVVRFEHRQVNASDRPADIEFFVAVPDDNERQKVRHFQADPGFIEELPDEYGNRILRYVDRNVPPGDVVSHGWIAEVSISSLVHGPLAAAATAAPLPAETRALYLRDGESYRIDSPLVRELAGRLAAPGGRAEDTVRNIFEYLVENLRYERDDVWDPAPVVLARKTGSCSEYNYAFVALCRAAGIPARYTGGIVLSAGRATRYDPAVTEDAVFHRWNEVFLPERGWFPVDCSRAGGEAVRYGNPENYYGRLPAGLLQCVRGDGLGATPLGWDYLSNAKLPYREEKDWSGKVAFWIDGVAPGALVPRVAAITKQLEGAQDRTLFEALVKTTLDREILFLLRNRLQAGALAELAGALHAAGHPEAIYWSILAVHRGLDVPEALRYPALCDKHLREQLERYLKPADGNDLFTFEYWWRKARPLVRFDEDRGLFVLTVKQVDIH
ncbi:MAG: transglutaminase domain-containing protein [Planctomycetes bacterium]|nr:transglutaminase domain-containing protein [Planctomycetota bacterium]